MRMGKKSGTILCLLIFGSMGACCCSRNCDGGLKALERTPEEVEQCLEECRAIYEPMLRDCEQIEDPSDRARCINRIHNEWRQCQNDCIEGNARRAE